MSRFPERLFALGNEPENKKVNTYFQLPYLDTISLALEEDHMEKLSFSQFGKLIEAGNKIASSVRFLHFILSRQLVTKKKKEVWCLFAGQPIRFSLREFAITTGLDCSKLPPPPKLKEHKVSEYTIELFGSEKNATPGWIATTLAGRPYKDKDTRFRLACLVLIDGIVCPTSRNAKISAEHIMMVKDVDQFLEYPWGRKSFDLTINSIKTRTATTSYLCQPTCVFQGFLHALQMVVLECAPSILKKDLKAKSSKPTLTDEEDEEDESPIISTLLSCSPITNSDMNRKNEYSSCIIVAVKAILPDDEHLLDDTDLEFDDDVPDESVDNLVAAISDGQKFSRKTWNGGENENFHIKHTKTPASSSRNTSSDVDLDTAASSILDKVESSNAVVLTEIKSLCAAIVDLRTDVSAVKEYIASLKGASSQFRAPSKGKPARRVKSSKKKVKHVRFQQISSSEESKSSSDHATKTKESSRTSGEPNDGADSTVGDGIEDKDGDDQEDRTGDDVGVDVSTEMQVHVDDVEDEATIASNQIAFVLSDLSSTVQVRRQLLVCIYVHCTYSLLTISFLNIGQCRRFRNSSYFVPTRTGK
ncbi:hypothetical protein EUTSA_v10002299mg [Eutrema salsugineum]|uniref:DUF1985 domain-containing protein n=1 Tax=Eutrema salsugineum TaxID=72664 RepID=V4MCH6_EUTSA|nr:hypothetical protein EUTSA_v10002299mg [Eutrema salsugineum]